MSKRILIILNLIYILQLTTELVTENNVDLSILNKNLFESLRIHPRLSVEGNLTEEEKIFIDKYVDNFLDLTVVSTENEQNEKIKRSLNIPDSIKRDEVGTFKFNGLKPLVLIPAHKSSQVQFFQHGSKVYVAALEQDPEENHLNFLVFKYRDNKLTRMPEWKVPTAIEFSLLSRGFVTYIVLTATDGYYSGIWEFNGNNLSHIQNFDFANSSDVKIWSYEDEMRMAVSYIRYKNSSVSSLTARNKTIVYKWLGSYFDETQEVGIDEPVSKLAAFSADHTNFLALIINDMKNEFSSEYAEIYRYNLQSGLYEIHQRIPTHNCKDIKFFSLKKNRDYDSYLVVANYVSGEVNDEIPSIIYKYVEGYFLPFQNLKIENVLEFLPIQTTDDKFLLIARTEFQSLKTYQYDGWQFQESTRDIRTDLPKVPVISVTTFISQHVPILVVHFYNEDELLQLYEFEFIHENQLNKFQDETLVWCEKNLKLLETLKHERGTIKKRQVETSDTEDQGTTENHNETVSSEEIITKINIANLILEELENQVDNSMQKEGLHVFQDIETEKIILQNSNITSLSVDIINDKNIGEILENLIHINQDFKWTDNLVLEHAQIDSKINPITINGRKTDDMLKLDDNFQLDLMNVNGEMRFSAPIIIQTLNNIPFDQGHILMNNMNQEFDSLNVEHLKTENLNPQRINSRIMRDLEVDTIVERKVDRIPNLKTEKIVIGGFINNVDMRTLNKYSLKIAGDQILTKKYVFEELQGNDMEIKELSEKNLVNNLVRIDSGEFKIDQDVQFTNHLTVNKLEVTEFLDLIPVVDGKLDVLLKDSEELQHIKAKKFMEEVELLNPIKLQGNIQSEELEKINPVVNVDGPLIFTGDFEITGNTTIEKIVKAGDIKSAQGIHSAKRILSHGLLLKEKEIDIQPNFQQQLNIDEIFIDKVNGINPQSWVVTGTQNKQFIHGAKVFVDDVTITGDTNFFKINNIEVAELENSALRKSGEQIISGKHTLMNVVANRVAGVQTTLGKNPWQNVITTDTEQTISGTTVINAAVMANSSKSNSIRIAGSTNKLNFTKMIEDTVTTNTNKPILGHKTFKNFTTTNLHVSNLEPMSKQKMIYNGEVRLENAAVDNIHFMKSCNDVELERFGVDTGVESTVEIISEPRFFDKFEVIGDVFIESGYLNNVNLQDFEGETVKIDGENEFGNVVFDGSVFSASPIVLQGHVENVDLDNLIQSNADEQQIVLDSKNFENNFTVFGNTKLEGAINGFNLRNACSFAELSEKDKEIEIHGNAIFTKGPHVHKILNITVKSIADNAWFKNKETFFTGPVDFEDVIMYNNVSVKGSVDGVELNTLKEEYFSKTKNQTIVGGLYFANHVNFMGNLVSPQMALNGVINDIKISDLSRTILLQDTDQVFEEVVYFEDLQVEELAGDYSVNSLNLETDLLRYDQKNIITGNKRLDYLKTENIELNKNIAIQNVDILDWMQNAILKKGIFNIEKRKIFRNDTHFDLGISLQGSMNGEAFTNETIMLKNSAQNISGQKKFRVNGLEQMKFKNMKLKGLLNNMQMSELFGEQIDDQPLTIKSPMHFHNDIFAKNLNMKYYKGINVEQFISDIFSLKTMDDLVEKYGKLLNISQKINKHLREQAFYLQYYRELQSIGNPKYIINSCCESPTLMYFEVRNGSYIMYYYYWEEDRKMFVNSELTVDMGYEPLKVQAFASGRQQFLYLEYPNEEPHPKGLITGQFWRVDNLIHLVDYGSIISDGVTQITPLRINESECILTLYHYEKSPDIFCDFNIQGNMRFYQSLQPGKYIQSTVTKIDDVPYIILVSNYEDTSGSTQGSVEIWCIHELLFGIRQQIHLSDPPPTSVNTITYKGSHYLSVAYRGGVQQGHVDILKFSKNNGKYEQFQKITLSNPIKAEFSILPSGELFLFVLGSPNKTLTIYKYEGISGFRKQITTSSIPDITGFLQFTIGKKHFVMIENGDLLKILQAQFKGNLQDTI